MMLLTELNYIVEQERYADLLRAAEHDRLIQRALEGSQRRYGQRWYNRYLSALLFALGFAVTSR